MVVNSKGARPETPGIQKRLSEWTWLHSWIFLAIVGLGFLVIASQNRYHYLAVPGSEKAFRIAKLSGTVDEFDPSRGWVSARLSSTAEVVVQPSAASSESEPTFKEAVVKEEPSEKAVQQPASEPNPTEEQPVAPAQPPATETTAAAPPAEELSTEEKFKVFKQMNADYGEAEFRLANDNLYPDWKKNVSPQGTWPEFLVVYQKFNEWWVDAGQPREPGFQLWKKFLAASGRAE